MAAPRVEKAYEKYAWIILFLAGILGSPGAYFNLVPGGDYVAGFLFLGFAVPTVLISATSYRKGKKWAWYLLWYVPVIYVIGLGIGQYASGQIPLWSTFLSPIPVLGLLLPYRKFFPKAQVAPK